MPSFKFYTITIGGSDYAAVSAEMYGLTRLIRKYMVAFRKDSLTGQLSAVEKLQSEWKDDPGFEVLNFAKYRFKSEDDQSTAIKAVNDVLQGGRDRDDEAHRHTDTYIFSIDGSGQPHVY